MVNAHHERQKNELKNRIALAWHTAAFYKQKRLPKLDEIIDSIDKELNKASKKEMTTNDMFDIAKKFNAKVKGR